MPLASPTQNASPLPLDLIPDPTEFARAMVEPKVLVEPAQHRRKVMLLFAFQPVPVPTEPLPRAKQELPATLYAGDTDQGEFPAAIHSTDMFEAQKLESLRPPAPLRTHCCGEAAEEQEPLLAAVQIRH
ncbi:hypothetical protein R69746_07544 [Paraburkholderia aspalathi]|nr:hypothetical protein R69746_07544 [Paraburkholderia aspalathi]